MKAILASILVCLLCASCVLYEDDAISATGNHERIRLASLGGTSSLRGANGASMTHDHQQSLRDAGVALGAVPLAREAGQTARFNTASTTAQQANARVPLVTQPASVAPGTTVFPIVTQPSTPVIIKP